MKKITLSLIALAITLTTFGQAPEGFKYQAVVRDVSNNILANQAVGMRLTIQQGSIGGTAVYTETFAPTTNGYGLVNLEIGTGTTTDDFTTIDWANGPYFIETAVDVAGGTSYVVMGTSQLMSVPFALYAKTSGSSIPGPQGPQGIQGNDGPAGPAGQGVAAEFIRTNQGPNASVAPGNAFTIDTEVFNNSGGGITAMSGNGGTVFSFSNAGVYMLDYEMSLASASSIGIYSGPSIGTMVLDQNTIAGSSTGTTWIHGRALVNITTIPTYVQISPVVGTSDVVTAGTAAGTYMIRLTIGTVGANGATGATGPAGPAGPLQMQFGMFYGLTSGTGNGGSTDYPATIQVKTSLGTGRVPFPQDGPASGITRVDASSFMLPNIGTYEINYSVHTTEPGQFQLELDGTGLPETLTSNLNPTNGGHPIHGSFFVTTTSINSVIALVNPQGNAYALTITPADGANTHANAPSITIKQIY